MGDFLRRLDRSPLRLLRAFEERVARHGSAVAHFVEHETLQMNFGDAHLCRKPHEFGQLVDSLLEASEPERDARCGCTDLLLIGDELADIAHDAVEKILAADLRVGFTVRRIERDTELVDPVSISSWNRFGCISVPLVLNRT